MINLNNMFNNLENLQLELIIQKQNQIVLKQLAPISTCKGFEIQRECD